MGIGGFGPVIATRAVELAIQKAEQTDISSIAVSRCNEVGRLGGYACLAADAEMIGLLMAKRPRWWVRASHRTVASKADFLRIRLLVLCRIEGQRPDCIGYVLRALSHQEKIRVKQHRGRSSNRTDG